ncbi:hypothetical protein NSK_008506 [Nannochloropsis salina CCMP1776]|uniref:Flagellar associated protein n=1 Tax=Nannochloropsis salina CCMP1776 TaxID=1027361 RepID=A0A4D9CTA8_9STRA|nr:hypothetical protein NSK_008506 [Nannochloropsis salina CCMP1776]|eukprot:TFJ79948.1 hypothetical protein NSK_008506 [Nannochloropsis salina CCMP1776]
MAAADTNQKLATLEPIALRQFTDPGFVGPKIYLHPKDFEAKVDNYLRTKTPPLREGYSSFCYHLIVPNFAHLKASYLKIVPENEHLIRTAYDANSPEDLPVLTRYFPASAVKEMTGPAKFLDVILYTREEIHQENMARGMEHLNNASDAPWGIMRVKAQDVERELPMLPTTLIRNALGKGFGGSGVPLDVDRYKESVGFWMHHAAVR